MPAPAFTARTIDALKPKPHRYSVYDPDCPGLVLRVTPTGVKTWSFLYRFGAKQKRLTFGAYGPAPALTLAEARARARRARVQVDDGHDPAARKLEAREAARRDTFGKLAELYLEKHAKRQKRSWTEDERILKRDLLPAWEDVPVKALTRRMVREQLDAIADRAPVMANRTLALVSKILNFGVDREWLDANPAARLKKPTREVSRERVLTDEEIATLWASLDASDALYARLAAEGRVTLDKVDGAVLLRPMLADWLRMRLLTAQRGGEIIRMTWADLDLDAKLWTIPSDVAKNKAAHVVPLADEVVTILERRRGAVDEGVPWVFPNDLNRGPAKDRAKKVTLRSLLPEVDDVRGHDLRRTAASGMARLGIARDTISRVLNHVERGPRATSVYDRYDRVTEKRDALDAWAHEVKRIARARR
jgi:integrase